MHLMRHVLNDDNVFIFDSSSVSDLNVTIAGTVCDIESTSSTQIVCITNSHKPAIETQVTVETEYGNMYPVSTSFL